MPKTSSPGRDRWRAEVCRVLARAGHPDAGAPEPESQLTHVTADGIAVGPLHTASGETYPRIVQDASWLVCPRLVSGAGDSAAVNHAALEHLENGATALWVTVDTGLDIAAVLDRVRPDLAPILFTPAGGPESAVAALDWARATEGAQVSLGVDPLVMDIPAPELAGLVQRAAEVPGDVRAVVADGSAAVEAGGTAAQQLALGIGCAITILRELSGEGVDPAQVAFDLRLAATADQFETLTTMRAARLLWARVADVLGVTTVPRIHAVTADVMMTVQDPWVNLLRTTIAAFAAGAGGADLVTVDPFDARLGLPDALAQRMARNTGSLLQLESHVGAVADPGAGSHYIEAATHALAERAWELVQQIEAAGGVREALPDIRSWVQESWQNRRAAIARREVPLTGVSEFPILDQPVLQREPAPEAGIRPLLEPVHLGMDFEALRARGTGELPVVLLGSLASSSARAGFMTNVLAAGGIRAVPVGPLTDPSALDDALTAAGVTAGGTVALAGTDDDYAASGGGVVKALREKGFEKVIITGKQSRLLAADAAVGMGDDIVEFLRSLS